MKRYVNARKRLINQSILWATAIIVSALLGQSAALSVLFLPALAYCALSDLMVSNQKNC